VAVSPVLTNDTAEQMVSRAAMDPGYVSILIGGLAAKDSSKLRCAKALNLLSASRPALLYPHFDFFAGLLDSPHNILKWNGIIILSNLTTVDSERKFDAIFDRYYRHLWDGDLITAANVIGSSGRIMNARPDLSDRIVTEILKVEEVPLPTCECREIARGKALLAFKESNKLESSNRIEKFIQDCVQSRRPATRKKAETLLKKVRGRTK
jgi:hypothetical protein